MIKFLAAIVLGLLISPPSVAKNNYSDHLQTIVLGSGCFWGAEKGYEALPGVIDAVSGYADGRGIKPSYKEIIKNQYRNDPNNYAEVVKVSYDPNQISTEQLLKHFYESHDPTQGMRQGNDIGSQYRSTILTSNTQQTELAIKLTAIYQQKLTQAGYGKITTIIKPLKRFYKAEEYHQDYISKNPNGYCPDHSTGVVFNEDRTPKKVIDNSALLTAKHIVVIDAPHCPYCEALKTKVLNDYQGKLPLHYRQSDELKGLTISSPTWATPTILFLEHGKEVWGHQGYIERQEFYKALGYFQLGKSEAYDIAFNKGTENRFCQQYEQFNNTGPGQFVDKLSGVPLFDTKHRYDSNSGWLSFYKALKDTTYTKADNSLGMRRTEVLSKSSNIHLGHVFNDGPNGRARYCINANVLEFRPRS
ncbi:peptide-methionine (S)-S-oxide reductase MsrA [Paraferrimonas sp. SM1919]|uniref:peptide-methionine (S)-S-oxide reductase MsrA n=1 Tax=Paraferrimonas sp. SM1919 TaxID=2662263 RepID=UPI0013D73393|nr:peptide-methionine (S)-S-oxide reductase MsrA [Paraferrimonas sp. SM1919]